MPGPEPSATAMSGQRPRETCNFQRLGLARASLMVLVMGMAGQSCLVTATPDLEAPKRTAPYLTSLTPATYQVYAVNSSPGVPTTTGVEFDVKSEDLGVPLVGFLLADFPGFEVPYTTQPLQRINPGDIATGHLGTLEARHFRSSALTLPDSPGCHSITLILTHEFKFFSFSIEPKDRANDMALATWWYDLDHDPANTTQRLQRCARGQSASVDAGSADGGAE